MTKLVAAVSPHGFGHAARSAALLEALGGLRPGLEIELWTTIPEWFFRESLSVPFAWRPHRLDVGLVQGGPLAEDLPATARALAELWTPGAARRLAAQLREAGAACLVADVAPLALEAARHAGVPAVLVENFTWDWIYEGYVGSEPRLEPWIERLRQCFDSAALRIQAEPVCVPRPGATRVGPIARRPRAGRAAVRRRLGIAPGREMVLVSFGGFARRFRNLDRWNRIDRAVDFVVPGASEREERDGKLILLPHRSPVHHPDLVGAADAVVGKLGYSTVAEMAAAGTRVAYVRRPSFRESEVLERWVAARLPAIELTEEQLDGGGWLERLLPLLDRPRPGPPPPGPTGAEQAARAVAELLDSL